MKLKVPITQGSSLKSGSCSIQFRMDLGDLAEAGKVSSSTTIKTDMGYYTAQFKAGQSETPTSYSVSYNYVDDSSIKLDSISVNCEGDSRQFNYDYSQFPSYITVSFAS